MVSRVKKTFWLTSKKWLGVKASNSLTSELTAINCFEFNVCPKVHIVVQRMSSVTDLVPNTTYIAFLHLLTNRSQIPLKRSAAGGLIFHLIPRWIRRPSITSLFHAATYSAKNRSDPVTNFSICCWWLYSVCPSYIIDRRIALRQQSLSKLGIISKCNALINRHVNRQHSCFSFLLPMFTLGGPR